MHPRVAEDNECLATIPHGLRKIMSKTRGLFYIDSPFFFIFIASEIGGT